MDRIARSIEPIRIQDEMRNSYMDYSMSVIIGRALPDVRDGLKPVHRRILFAMHQMGLASSKRYSKCAGTVGEVLKLYHPHGDSAVYDAMVRMAQPWNLRYLLVDGQGNFGSVDGDPAAAYRYTEARMTKLAEEMLVDIDKQTVSFAPNFDGTTLEPEVLPARFPNLLVNGAEGIAVGMATKIPPHNLGEVIDGCVALIDNPGITLDELMEHIPGPDFPTSGTIYGRLGVREAYETGRGRVVVRGNAAIEEMKGGRQAIVIDEIPYQVNKARLIQQIAQLVKDKRLDGISALRDESDRRGMRIVIELKRDAYGEVVLNHLYKHTALQSTFGVILLAIVNQRPRVLTLKEMLQHYVAHRREVILRRTRYELERALERAHIVEGYLKALDVIQEIIDLIRASATAAEARTGLMATFDFTEVQAQAILDMRLQRLTGMERQKLEDEYAELQSRITRYREILGSESELMGVVKAELTEVREAYADERRTRFTESRAELTMHDLVAEEDQVVTLSHLGYVKRCAPKEWRMQHRGGMGKRGMTTRDEDFVEAMFIANTHDLLLVFTSDGRVLPLHVYEVPEAGRDAKGRPIVNLVPLGKQERIASVVSVRELVRGEDHDGPERHLLFVSRLGLVKRTPLPAYRNLRQGGMIAAGVAEGDSLLKVLLVAGDEDVDVMLLKRGGRAIRFHLEQVPVSGRSARGNKGVALSKGDEVVDAIIVPAGVDEGEPDDEPDVEATEEEGEVADEGTELMLMVTENGYGKRTPVDGFRVQNRNGKGIIAQPSGRGESDAVVGALRVGDDDQVMLVTDTGRVIRIAANSVNVFSRYARGVRLMRLDDGERIVDVARLEDPDEDEEAAEAVEAAAAAAEASVEASPGSVGEAPADADGTADPAAEEPSGD